MRASAYFDKRHFDLWWQFTVRAVEMRHRGSYLGLIWTVLNPLLMLAMYVTVFSLIFPSHLRTNETPVEYALAVFVGLILFHTTSETVAAAPGYVVTSPNLVKKVVFPLLILPIANTSALWIHFLISFVLLLIAVIATGHLPSIYGILWMPLILAPQIMLTLGTACVLSALGVFFRDISQLVGFISTLILWTSGVFFSAGTIAERSPTAWLFLKWNPMLQTIDLARHALLWNDGIGYNQLAYTWSCGCVMMFVGIWCFRKIQPAFADVL